MKIAIVGGGIFGVTIAWYLAKSGFSVDLFEKEKDILCATSGINQYRLHRGYHYPRSKETAILCKEEEAAFVREYGECVISDNDHYYCVAKEGSLADAVQCKQMWIACGLDFDEQSLPIVRKEKISFCARVHESIFDPELLKKICWGRLKRFGVNVHLNHHAVSKDLEPFDMQIIATYAYNNDFLDSFASAKKNYQFELCEKPVVRLPVSFKRKSVVVLDGPFMCIDPLAKTGLFLMGNVVHALHSTNIGFQPMVPESFKPLLNRGIIRNPPVTNFAKFIERATEFFPEAGKAEHVGSMYTVRTVLPFREHDDARPTIIEQISDRLITVFSGKIGTCVMVAEQIQSMLLAMPSQSVSMGKRS